MAISVKAAANYICDKSGWKITQLSLQKILYMAHMVHMGRTNGERLIDESFESLGIRTSSSFIISKSQSVRVKANSRCLFFFSRR